MSNKRTLADEIDAYVDLNPVRFHTPGHKGLLNNEDITELYFSDDYFNPTGAIREIMNRGKEFYRSRECFLSTQGSTLGVLSAVFAVRPKKVIIPEYSHRCVYNACLLAGAHIYKVANIEQAGIKYPLTPEQVARALEHSKADCVLVTSPDYFGMVADLASIKSICLRFGATLIVDAAHGAHFPASPHFTDNYVCCDISVTSAHKTLEALTQGAFINCYNSKYIESVKSAIEILATTSPSYLIMLSLESALFKAKESGGTYSLFYLMINELKRKYPFVKNDDFTRLVLDCKKIGGGEVANNILQDMKIISEKVFGDYIVFIITPADSAEEVTLLDKGLSMLFPISHPNK